MPLWHAQGQLYLFTYVVPYQEMGAAVGGETAMPVSPAVALGAREVLTREPDKEATEREEKIPAAVVQEINLDSR
jgi:hypothetical protein